jgi:hypothetical protein
LVIQAMLQSPYFLYRTELGTAAAGATRVPLDDWEVGAKLALAITNTIPDDALLAAAAAGQLHDAAGVSTQAKRLLDGTTGTTGLKNFNFQVTASARTTASPGRGGVSRFKTNAPLA